VNALEEDRMVDDETPIGGVEIEPIRRVRFSTLEQEPRSWR